MNRMGWRTLAVLRRSGCTWVEVLLALAVSALVAGDVLPEYIRTKESAKAAEAKQALHVIQLGAERYGVDMKGLYPTYLIGGEARAAMSIRELPSGQGEFSDIRDCPQYSVSDVLLREGYLPSYPVNPFIRNGHSIHELQEDMGYVPGASDPLRNGSEDALAGGTRFGTDGSTMGNMLADHRYTMWTAYDAASDTFETRDTWANIGYEMWDLWAAELPEPYLPGEFFYKSAGQIEGKYVEQSTTWPALPVKTDMFMLGVYGGVRHRGTDSLGEEHPLSVLREAREGDALLLWPWTRSDVMPSSGERQGSPYGSGEGEHAARPSFGNSNGIKDATILVLASSEPVE
jgi:hypothetical protein